MAGQDRRRKRNWVPALLASFWILLALASSAYLYHLITDPNARHVEAAAASQAAPSAPPGETASAPPSLSAADAQALVEGSAAKDREIAELKTQLSGLTSQVSELGVRLRPLEKVLGPVASLPGSTSVTTSDPGEPGEPAGPVIADEPLSAAAKARLEKPLPPGTSVPQTKPTDLSAMTAKPAVPPKPAPKPEVAAIPPEPAEPPVAPAKPANEAKAPEKPAEIAAAKPAPPVPPKSAEPPKQQTARAEPAPGEPVKPAPKPAEPAKPLSGASNPPPVPPVPPQPPVKPAAQAADKVPASPPAPEPQSDDDGSGPVELSANEPANAPPETGADTPSLSAPAIPPGTTRFGIELGSVQKQDGVRPLWRDLLTNHAALVAGLQARRIIAPDKKWRLIAGPFSSAAEAMQACTLFKKADMPCEATVFAGDSL